MSGALERLFGLPTKADQQRSQVREETEAELIRLQGKVGLTRWKLQMRQDLVLDAVNFEVGLAHMAESEARKGNLLAANVIEKWTVMDILGSNQIINGGLNG